jgi:hypothetical protein
MHGTHAQIHSFGRKKSAERAIAINGSRSYRHM